MSTILNDDSSKDQSRQGENAPPPLAALFLIQFDVRVGYTLSWHRSIDGGTNSHRDPQRVHANLTKVTLEGVVEYKSLPSGLHNLKEDLVYFVHENNAGLSAFVSGHGSQEERNARFVAVGVLVPLRDGRLGRAWLHALPLKALARELVADTTQTEPLEQYWNDNQIHDQEQSEPLDLRASQRRDRRLSTATVVLADQVLPSEHPAFSVLEYLDTFGPLVFPLHRAALLRQRILLVRPPPVQLTCDYVYNISILSTLTPSLAAILNLPSSSLSRLRPLFALGIHDIPFLEKVSKNTSTSNGHPLPPEETNNDSGTGWVGCTTDEILSLKSNLFDMVVQLPSSERLAKNQPKRWPVLKRASDGKEIKATQRDLRRYRSLRRALAPANFSGENGSVEDDEHMHLLFGQHKDDSHDGDIWNGDEDKVVEPSSWGALAYSSFIWWASAGEKDESQFEEDNLDQQLLGDLSEVAARRGNSRRYHDEAEDTEAEDDENSSHDKDATLETAVIAYFHRVTKRTFEACAEALDLSADEDDEDQDDRVRSLGSVELRRMGLDVWSDSDKEFVRQFVPLWFGKEAEVHGMGIECCGVRIC